MFPRGPKGGVGGLSLPTILFLLLLCLPCACGKKGPVRPLLEDRPAAPEHLDARQQGSLMLVSWAAPRTTQNNEPLTDLLGFRVYKMRYDLAADCLECRDTSVLLLDVDLDYLREVRRHEGRFYFWDDQLDPGYGYQYRVVGYDHKGHNGTPTRVRVPFVLPPPPPSGLDASGHDRLVRLSWQPPSEERQGIDIVGYNVYRRIPGEPFPPLPLNGSPLADAAFEDYGLENDTAYDYGVRTVIRLFGKNVESELSETRTVTPEAGR